MPHFTRRLTTWLFAILTLASTASAGTVDLTGEWEIQEEERTYTATLDRDGNGTYTWQNGRIATTSSTDGRWEGLWTQTGNDREGGFDFQRRLASGGQVVVHQSGTNHHSPAGMGRSLYVEAINACARFLVRSLVLLAFRSAPRVISTRRVNSRSPDCDRTRWYPAKRSSA